MKEKIKRLLKPRIKLVPGTRLASFLFIALSVAIAAGILIAANMYYNIDTGEVVLEEVQRVTQVIRATAGLIVGGTASQNPESDYVFQAVGKSKIATTTLIGYLETINLNEAPIRFATTSGGFYVGFKAPANLAQNTIYTWPTNYALGPYYILTSDTSGNLNWTPAGTGGIGDITAVGDVASGDAFISTPGTQYGNTLWFHPNATYTLALTASSELSSNATITLPAASGYVALGSSTAGYVAYWSSANVLAGEQYLSTSRGGIGTSSASWTGMVRVSGGSWGATTSSPNYIAVWDNTGNFITGVSILDLTRGGTGANLSGGTQGGIIYMGSGSLAVSTAGTSGQLLVSGGAGAPTWSNIADLITATNGVTSTGATTLTLKLGGTLTENTTLSLGNYNLVFNLNGTGQFKVSTSSGDILIVAPNGNIYYKSTSGYKIAAPGNQILREMVPIMGFDLPVKTATSGTVTISRTIQSYPFSNCSPGTQRVHKLVIRYGSVGTTTWQIATSGGQVATFTVPTTGVNSTSSGTVYITNVTIPTPSGSCTGWQGLDTDDWYLRISPSSNDTMIYQIFLAAYDEIL